MYQLLIKEAAVLMTRDAYWWYEEQQKNLGENFLNVLNNLYGKIQVQPEIYGVFHLNFRKVKLPKFPYLIIYEIIDNQIVVFAVFHTSRHQRQIFKR